MFSLSLFYFISRFVGYRLRNQLAAIDYNNHRGGERLQPQLMVVKGIFELSFIGIKTHCLNDGRKCSILEN